MAQSKHRITFGIDPTLSGATWQSTVETWRRAEALGFESGWVSDHLIAVSSQPLADSLEAWTLQAALAASTSRIRIGCLVTGNTYRHPVVLAKMATTLDHISGGRLDFGLGAGWSREDHDPYGIPFYTFHQRADRLDEALEVITRLWADGEYANFEGAHYRLENAIAQPKPLQRPRPPIMIGGAGERTLRTVARWAEIWNVAGSPSFIREKGKVLERHCAEIGRDPGEIQRSVLISAIFADDPARRDHIIETRRRSDSPSRGQRAGKYVPMAEDEAVNAILLGSPQEIIDHIGRFVEVGVTHFILTVPYPPPKTGPERFAAEVMPAFR